VLSCTASWGAFCLINIKLMFMNFLFASAGLAHRAEGWWATVATNTGSVCAAKLRQTPQV
jgi:hypothetical protein